MVKVMWCGRSNCIIPMVIQFCFLFTDEYYNRTITIVTDLLRNRIKKIPIRDKKQQAKEWDIWIKNWAQFSFGAFIRSTATGIKSQLEKGYLTQSEVLQVDELDKYLPWPDPAITAYTVFDYYLALDVSLGKWLIEEMAQWFSLNMHTLEGGLSALPNAFATQGEMEGNITYNRSVTKVEYIWTSDREKLVKVSGVFTTSGEKFCVTGRSVILTPPLHVIRGIQIVNGITIPDGIDPRTIAKDSILKPFPKEFQKAIQNISYTPSTKIMLQYKRQFWNTGKDAEKDILAGCSRTNMPIGQLYYPTEVEMYKASENNVESGVEEIDGYVIKPAPVTEDQKGILMVYTWKSEALLWGALTKDMAIRLAVDQVDELHPGMNTKELFEVGSVEAWASDPTTLGGFAILRPREYLSVLYLMQNSWRNIYFAGEGISFASGWIQGALESGLRAAYQLFADDQPKAKPTKVCE
jgi:monoamine oxidase